MQVRFWGTRGSFAKPGASTVRYGGNTSCVQVVSSAGTLLIIDCGTGAHELGQLLMRQEKQPIKGHILISHTHWDHIQGIPFFAPLFIPGNSWDFYAPQGFGESLRDTLGGQMEYTYFPVTPDAFGAEVRYNNLTEGSFRIDDIVVHTRYLNHPALTLAYRIEVDGVAIVYSCDHEPHSRQLAMGEGPIEGEDRLHAEFFRGADLVIHDAQYTPAEYATKIGWGHSTAEYAVKMCQSVGRQAGRADPPRSDAHRRRDRRSDGGAAQEDRSRRRHPRLRRRRRHGARSRRARSGAGRARTRGADARDHARGVRRHRRRAALVAARHRRRRRVRQDHAGDRAGAGEDLARAGSARPRCGCTAIGSRAW